MTFPFCGLDENDTFHLGTFDAVHVNFAAASGRGSPFHSLAVIYAQTLISIASGNRTLCVYSIVRMRRERRLRQVRRGI